MAKLETSKTFTKAAVVERKRLARARQRLEAKRSALQNEIADLERDLEVIDDRATLLGSLGVEIDDDQELLAQSDEGIEVLRGAAIRERAARRFFLSHGAGKAMHYRHWFELLLEEGVEIAGKDPLATFLTNLSRSAVVIRGGEPGSYAIDSTAPEGLRVALSERQAELRDLSEVIAREVTPVDSLRDRRSDLLSEIRRLEASLSEAERVLAPVDAHTFAQREAA